MMLGGRERCRLRAVSQLDEPETATRAGKTSEYHLGAVDEGWIRQKLGRRAVSRLELDQRFDGRSTAGRNEDCSEARPLKKDAVVGKKLESGVARSWLEL